MDVANPKTETRRFLRFVLVGVINTLVDFVVFNLMAGLFKLPLLTSQAISFIAGVTTSFILSRKYVYPEANSGQVTNQFPKFLVINLIGLAVRSFSIPALNGLFLGVLNNTKLLSFTPEFVSRNLAWAISTLVVLSFNFFGNRAWTFRTNPTKELA
jgi:putative flippase GtrA